MIDHKKYSGWLLIASFLLSFLVVEQAGAEMLPSGLQSWSDSQGNHETRLGGLIHNYQQDDSTWAEINTGWEVRDDTSYKNIRGLLKVYASDNGQCQIRLNIKGHSVVIEQVLNRLVFLDTLEYRHEDLVTNLVWGEPVMNGRDLTWGFSHWSYRIRKGCGAVGNQVAFNPQALNWIVGQWEGLPAGIQPHAALANVFKYEITVDGEPLPDSWFTDDSLCVMKRLKRIGHMVLNLSRQNLYMGADHQLPVPVRQHWIKRDGAIYCAEYVMMPEIDSVHTMFPNKVLWHAATVAFTGGIEDTYIYEQIQRQKCCYGMADHFFVGHSAGNEYVGLVRVKHVADSFPAGAVLDSFVYTCYAAGASTADTLCAVRTYKPWQEGVWSGAEESKCYRSNCAIDSGATWLDWGTGGSYPCEQWGTAGAQNRAPSVDNTGDGSGYDADTTAHDWVVHDGSGQWIDFRIFNSYVQGVIDGDSSEVEFLIESRAGSGEALSDIWQTEYPYTPNSPPKKPYATMYYHEGPPDVRHSPDGAGVRHSPDGVSVRHRP